MKKKITLILLILVALSSILFINLGNKSTADECKDCDSKKPLAVPTPPGNADYTKINCNCSEATPTIKASASTIAPGGSITLWVDSGGKACPDFTWSISSAKYTLNKSKTTADFETVTMTAASGICSTTGYDNSNIYVTVTVMDRCEITNQIIILNTAGHWKNIGSTYARNAMESDQCGAWGGSSPVSEEYSSYYREGKYRWRLYHSSGWSAWWNPVGCAAKLGSCWNKWESESYAPPQGTPWQCWLYYYTSIQRANMCQAVAGINTMRADKEEWKCSP
jgi:hypothetical protein